jgi:hypothetical protein
MPLATKRGPAEALVAGRFGFPQIANCFVFNIATKKLHDGFAGAAPGENLKRILNERRMEVNRRNSFTEEIQGRNYCDSSDAAVGP